MNSLKDQVEAILFASGRKMRADEIARLCKSRDLELVKASLKELQQKYEQENSSLVLVGEGEVWNLTVRERYLPLVQKIVSETELPKSVIETLAVIAWKSPVLQSELIRVRTNKAYDHIHQLEEMGFITAKKHGRTRELRLGDSFYKYFDMRGEGDLKEKLKQVREEEIRRLAEAKRKEKDSKKKEEEEQQRLAEPNKAPSEQVREFVEQARKEIEAEKKTEPQQAPAPQDEKNEQK
jgi:segregation and condensation protein B